MSEDRRAVYFYTGRKLTNASFLVTSQPILYVDYYLSHNNSAAISTKRSTAIPRSSRSPLLFPRSPCCFLLEAMPCMMIYLPSWRGHFLHRFLRTPDSQEEEMRATPGLPRCAVGGGTCTC